MSAADDYRAVIARLDVVADALRVRDGDRAAVLRAELNDLDRAVEKAGARADLTRFVVDMHWETALEELWPEQWLKLRPKPGPDPRVTENTIDRYDEGVVTAIEALQAVVRRRFRFPGRG